MKLAFEVTHLPFPLQLWKMAGDRYKVVYGLQVRSNLSYAAAAEEFGSCLMHNLTCDGRMDETE